MAVKQRITRKSLKKPDEFLTTTQKALDFVGSHSKAFLTAASCVLLAALIAVALDWYKHKQVRKASIAFASAVRLYEQSQYGRALEAFQEIASIQFAGPYRDLSTLYHANCQIRLNIPGEAVKTLTPVVSSKNALVKAVALKLKGDAETNLGHTNAAIASYRQAAAVKGPLQSESLLLQARQLEKKGRPLEAATLYQNFLQSFPNSADRPMVEAKVRSIKK